MYKTMTPYVPPTAIPMVQDARAKGLAVFIKAPQRLEGSRCPNRQDLGVVILSVADSGPYSYIPAGKRPITYYQGDGEYGKGWYIIRETYEFDCPDCEKHPASTDEVRYERPEWVNDKIRECISRMSHRRGIAR